MDRDDLSFEMFIFDVIVLNLPFDAVDEHSLY